MIYAPDASTNVVNCLPVADGWGPMPGFSIVSSALGETPRGMIYARTSAGLYRIIVGTETKLYELNTSTFGWTDISRTSGGAYAVPEGDDWQFEVFGANLIAVNGADAPQFLNVDSGTNFAALAGSPPKAKYVWTAGDYLVLGHLENYPNRIQTSGLNNAEFWTVGQRGCDYQDFPDGEEVMGGVGAATGAIIFQRRCIRAMSITTGTYSFTIDVINPDRGVIAPLSIAQIGPGQFIYYSADGFFMGAEGTPIGREKVDRWFDGEIDRNTLYAIKAMVDPYNKVVFFRAQKPDASTFLLGYHWGLDRWFYSNQLILDMASLVTPAITIDGMDSFYSTIDAATVPFDSRLFTGGSPTTAAFDSAGRLCYLTGSPLAATLDTPDVELAPGRRSFLQKARVIGNVPSFTLTPITSEYSGGERTVRSGTFSPYLTTGVVHYRVPGRYHAFRMSIDAGTNWTHVAGIEPEARAEGLR